MELRHLRTFIAVADELHFRRAAARLYLAPPTVTEHVQALERELRTALFRRGRTVQLTPDGQALLAHARQLVAAADQARHLTRGADPAPTGERLRVGILSNGAGALTGRLLSAFLERHPRAQLATTRLNFTDYLSALVHDQIDVAFVRADPGDERVAAVALNTEQRVAVLASRHPLAEARAVQVTAVLEERFIGLHDDTVPAFRDYLYLRGARNGQDARRSDETCRDVADVLAAVAAGRGVATAVESFRGYDSWPGISYVSLIGAPAATNVVLYRRAERSPLVGAFLAGLATRAVTPDQPSASARPTGLRRG